MMLIINIDSNNDEKTGHDTKCIYTLKKQLTFLNAAFSKSNRVLNVQSH